MQKWTRKFFVTVLGIAIVASAAQPSFAGQAEVKGKTETKGKVQTGARNRSTSGSAVRRQ